MTINCKLVETVYCRVQILEIVELECQEFRFVIESTMSRCSVKIVNIVENNSFAVFNMFEFVKSFMFFMWFGRLMHICN